MKYMSIEEITKDEKYPFTKWQLRHFLKNKNQNGLHKITYKVGKRIYLRSDLFDEWIESHKN